MNIITDINRIFSGHAYTYRNKDTKDSSLLLIGSTLHLNNKIYFISYFPYSCMDLSLFFETHDIFSNYKHLPVKMKWASFFKSSDQIVANKYYYIKKVEDSKSNTYFGACIEIGNRLYIVVENEYIEVDDKRILEKYHIYGPSGISYYNAENS